MRKLNVHTTSYSFTVRSFLVYINLSGGDIMNEILDEKAMQRAVTRISHEIIEKNKGTENIVIVGIKRRGVPIAQRIANKIHEVEGVHILVGQLDITMYRDDLAQVNSESLIGQNSINVEVKDKKVILVDDVLYTGRTARAALEAIIHAGRPQSVQLAVMIDRGHRELPIRPDYVGKNVPTSRNEIVHVMLQEIDNKDAVVIKK